MEQRQLLTAVMAPPQAPLAPVTAPLPPMPGQTFWVKGGSGTWDQASAITPNTTNDLILNTTPTDTDYSPCCEAGGTNNIQVFTNGTLESNPPASPGGVSDPSAPDNVIADLNIPWHATYSLGSNPNGYDISEIDSIAGHQDYRTQQNIDLEVQFVGSSQFVSLSGGAGFHFTQVPDPTSMSGVTALGRGSSQMAIVNDTAGQPIASNVAAVRFDDLGGQGGGAFFRELVVTGAVSTNVPNSAPAAPSGLTAQFQGSAVNLSFTDNATNEFGFLIQRASSAGGPFTTIGTIPSSPGQGRTITFTDRGINSNSTYFYKVVAFNNFGGGSQVPSNVAGPVTIGNVGVEAHYYNVAFWAGTPAVSTTAINVDASWGSGSPDPAIRPSNNSTVFTGKVRTDAGGVYTFISNTDDDGYLYVNGQLVSIDAQDATSTGGHGEENATNLTPITLAANTSYDFVLLQTQGGGGAGAHMLWVEPGQTTPSIVPADHLTPMSDTPQTPSNLQTDPFSILPTNPYSHAVDFTFDSNNNAVVKYLLQRRPGASTSESDWATVNTTDPQGSVADFANTGEFLEQVQDASTLPGTAYQYRVLAMNFDHTSTPSNVVSVTTPALPAQAPGVEARFFNGELAAADFGDNPRNIMVNGSPSEFNSDSAGLPGGSSAAPIDANWGNGSPDTRGYPDVYRIHPDDYATLMTGKIHTDAAGMYTFITNSDDDGYMWVNDVLVSSDPGGHGQEPAPNIVPISLAANTEYDFVVIQQEMGGGSGVHASWIEPDGMGGTKSQTVIPAFTPDTGGGALGGFVMNMDAPNKQSINASGAIVTDNSQSAAGNVAVSSIGPGGIVVSWTDQSFSELWYEVQRSTDGTNWATIGRAGFNTNSFTDPTTTIPAGTTYFYRVRGMNFDSPPGTFSNSGDTAHVKLLAPSVSASNCFPGVVTLSWNDTGESETAYGIYDSTTQGGPYTLVTTVAPNTTSYDVTGLNPASTYYFVIKAVGGGNVADSPNSTEVKSRASGAAPVQHGPNDGNGHFTGATDLTLNGDAFINSSGDLQLDKPPTAFSTGTAFTTLPEGDASFDTTFQLTDADASSSGFAFVIQAVDPHQVGVAGAGLGYGGIPNSVAVKFRLSGGRNDTGVYTDGTTNDSPAQNLSTTPAPLNTAIHMNLSPSGAATGIDFHSGVTDTYQVHITYDGATLTEVVTDVTTSASITQTYSINIESVVGGPCAFVGLTGSTGSGNMLIDILNWTGTFNTGPTPVFSQTVNGTAGNDTITVKKDSDGLHDDIWVGAPTTATPTQESLVGQTIVINGAGGNDTLTLDSSNGTPLPSGGLHPVLRLNSGTGKFTIAGGLPTIDADHIVDVGKSTVQIPYTGASILPAIQKLLHDRQIKSSDAAASAGKFAVADVDSGSQVTLSYRVVGDLDGNGTVAFADLLALAQHYNQTGADWSKGDLNYDGTVGFADLLALAQHYNQTASAAPAAAAASPILAADTLDSTLLKKKSRK